jgi:hypothetical protein
MAGEAAAVGAGDPRGGVDPKRGERPVRVVPVLVPVGERGDPRPAMRGHVADRVTDPARLRRWVIGILGRPVLEHGDRGGRRQGSDPRIGSVEPPPEAHPRLPGLLRAVVADSDPVDVASPWPVVGDTVPWLLRPPAHVHVEEPRDVVRVLGAAQVDDPAVRVAKALRSVGSARVPVAVPSAAAVPPSVPGEPVPVDLGAELDQQRDSRVARAVTPPPQLRVPGARVDAAKWKVGIGAAAPIRTGPSFG